MVCFNSKYLTIFFINLYDLTEEIMTANIAEVINIFTISDSKIYMGGRLTFFV